MKKVYVVTRGCYSDYRIEECFDNRDSAEQYIESLKETEGVNDYTYDPATIETYDLLSTNTLAYHAERVNAVYAQVYYGEEIDTPKIGDIRMRQETRKGYISRKIEARAGENKEDFLKRAHKILIDEYFAWKAGRQTK